MLLSFLVLLNSMAAAPTAGGQPVHIWSDPAQTSSGAQMRVFVTVDMPGYLLVLRRRPDGQTDVLFPANPDANPYTPAGTYEITGPDGAAGAFMAAEVGSGVLLAALSDAAFQTSEFVRGAAWSGAALSEVAPDQDAEAALTEIVQRMLGSESFNYDLTTYVVTAPEPEPPIATTESTDVPLLGYALAPAAPLAATPAPIHCQLAPRHHAVSRTTPALAVYQSGQLAVTRPSRPTLPPIVIVQPRTRVHQDLPTAPPPTQTGSVAAAPRDWAITVGSRGGERASAAPPVRGTSAAPAAQAAIGSPAPGRATAALAGSSRVGAIVPSTAITPIPASAAPAALGPRTFALPRSMAVTGGIGGVVTVSRHR